MNPFGPQLLNLIAYLPLVGAVACLLVPKGRPGIAAKVATLVAAADLILSVPLWAGWAAATPDAYGFRFVIDVPWIQHYGIRYIVGVDGISMLLVLLTTPSDSYILSSWSAVHDRESQYYACLLVPRRA
jgi:NADH-quinone oxidoreductase subunit M